MSEKKQRGFERYREDARIIINAAVDRGRRVPTQKKIAQILGCSTSTLNRKGVNAHFIAYHGKPHASPTGIPRVGIAAAEMAHYSERRNAARDLRETLDAVVIHLDAGGGVYPEDVHGLRELSAIANTSYGERRYVPHPFNNSVRAQLRELTDEINAGCVDVRAMFYTEKTAMLEQEPDQK